MSSSRNHRAVLAARILLLGAAAAALAGAFWLRLRADGRPPAPAGYVCPMHPEVRSHAPGACPICQMALEPAHGARAASPRERAEMSDLAAVENVRKHNIVDFVRRQTPLFNAREMRGPAWVGEDGVVTGIFYQDQIAAMAAGETGQFSLTRAPAQVWPVRWIQERPRPWDSSTASVRFQARRSPPPAPGAVGWIELARRSRQMVTVPVSALVQSPEGPYVLVATGGLALQKRPVQIGETFFKQGLAAVLSGLEVNERVVSRATFFIDADRRLALP